MFDWWYQRYLIQEKADIKINFKLSSALFLKDAMKRTAVGIWKCKGCRKTIAGGAWAPKYGDFFLSLP